MELFLNQKFPIFISIFLFSTLNFFSQETKMLNEEIKILEKSSEIKTDNSLRRFLELIDVNQSCLYITNNDIKRFKDEKPLVIDTDIISLRKINNDLLEDMVNVELLLVRLKNPSDLQSPIDFKILENINKLRYIYFLVEFELCPEQKNDFECEKLKIKSLFKDELKPNITILYNISIPN